MARIAVKTADTPQASKLLDSDELSIGRSSTCEVVLADGRVSRQHCILRRTKYGFRIYSQSDTKRTRVNGETVEEDILLQSGDIIRVGGTELLYVTDPEEFPQAPESERRVLSRPKSSRLESGFESSRMDSAAQQPVVESVPAAQQVSMQPSYVQSSAQSLQQRVDENKVVLSRLTLQLLIAVPVGIMLVFCLWYLFFRD